MTRIFFLWLALVLPGMSWAQSSPDGTVYRIGIQDMVRLEIVGEGDLNRVLEVQEHGGVDVPLAGPVLVSGLSLQEATTKIRAALSDGYFVSPQVTLKMDQYRSQPVQIHGAVNKPGTYYLQGHTTASELIATAGGTNVMGVMEARITREEAGSPVILTVNLERLFAGELEEDLQVLTNDKVYIPQVEQVFVQGEVKNQGAVAYREGMTATHALGEAGGPLGTARLRDAYILRTGERLEINLRHIMSGREADYLLHPGDQLVVPESVF